jgi:hypothetical protein
MTVYTLVLFLHVIGAVGVFIGFGIWLCGLAAIRRAHRVEQVRAIVALITSSDPVTVASILLLAAAGLYLALTTWGLRTGWIDVAIVSFVLLAPVGPGIIEPRLHAIARVTAETPDGPIPEKLEARIHDPLMHAPLHMVVALLLGIVFLMTTKPSLVVSIIAMAVSLTLGLAAGVPLWRSAQRRPQRVAARTEQR